MQGLKGNAINTSVKSRKVNHSELLELLKIGQFKCVEINEIFGSQFTTDSVELKNDYIHVEKIKKDGDDRLTNYYTFADKKVNATNSSAEEIFKRYKNARSILTFIRAMNKCEEARIIFYSVMALGEAHFDVTLIDLNDINRIESGIQVYVLQIKEKLSLLASREKKIFLCRNVNVAVEMGLYKQVNHWYIPFVFLEDLGKFREHTYRHGYEMAKEEFFSLDVLSQMKYMKKTGLDGMTRRNKLRHVTLNELSESNVMKQKEFLTLVNQDRFEKKHTVNARASKKRKTIKLIDKNA